MLHLQSAISYALVHSDIKTLFPTPIGHSLSRTDAYRPTNYHSRRQKLSCCKTARDAGAYYDQLMATIMSYGQFRRCLKARSFSTWKSQRIVTFSFVTLHMYINTLTYSPACRHFWWPNLLPCFGIANL